MLRIALVLAPWLLVPTCAGFCTGFSRAPYKVTTCADLVFADLWEPLAFGCFLLFVPVLLLAGVSIRAGSLRARQSLRSTRSVIWPWLLLAPCLAFLVVSALAHEEAARAPWRSYYENFEDSVPADYQPLGLFGGPWRETARLSYELFLLSLASFGAWVLARGWVARRAVRRAH